MLSLGWIVAGLVAKRVFLKRIARIVNVIHERVDPGNANGAVGSHVDPLPDAVEAEGMEAGLEKGAFGKVLSADGTHG